MRRIVLTVCIALAAAGAAWAGGTAEVSPEQTEDGFTKVEAKEMEFRWKVDGQQIDFVVSAPTTGWVAVGFDPSTAMKDAQMIFGFVENGTVQIRDHFGDGAFSHKADTALGGSDDVRSPGGSEENGNTTLSFSIPIDSGDQYDVPLKPGTEHTVLFAYGPDGEDNFTAKHSFRVKVDLTL
jgi:hypothetical protein